MYMRDMLKIDLSTHRTNFISVKHVQEYLSCSFPFLSHCYTLGRKKLVAAALSIQHTPV